MDPLELLELAGRTFSDKVSLVPADRWNADSPCAGWDTAGVVEHVVDGNVFAVRLLGGASAADAVVGLDGLSGGSGRRTGDVLVSAATETARDQVAAFRAADLDATVHHPASDMPGSLFLLLRTGDLAVHAWDVARAAGVDERLDPALVDAYWEAIQPWLPILIPSGAFGDGPSGAVPDDATTQTRMLDALGRRP